jgi:hypothetical protein
VAASLRLTVTRNLEIWKFGTKKRNINYVIIECMRKTINCNSTVHRKLLFPRCTVNFFVCMRNLYGD